MSENKSELWNRKTFPTIEKFKTTDPAFASVEAKFRVCKVLDIESYNRAEECVNAMNGIPEPQKLRETWEVVKDLKLDAYHNLKVQRDSLHKVLIELVHAITFRTSVGTDLIHEIIEARKVLKMIEGGSDEM